MVSLDVQFTPWSTLKPILGTLPNWWPEEERQRIKAYEKYDQLYWNDPTQYKIRVLEGESPIYIPKGRTVVDTTSHYLLKGLQIAPEDPNSTQLKEVLDALLKREAFYSEFALAKLSGVARGDFAFHMTADPWKLEGSRISLKSIDPAMVLPVYDPDNRDRLVRIHIVDQWIPEDDPTHIMIKMLQYWWGDASGKEIAAPDPNDPTAVMPERMVWRQEGLYETDEKWWLKTAKPARITIRPGPLDPLIPAFPVYWFKNLGWQGQQYGSSELRGFEHLIRSVSQGSTDTEMALALEGLGVYATDGGRPVDDDGNEEDWEVAPGKVMEVPQGSYFRRVEGVGSVTPMHDQLKYLEAKMHEAAALTDVAMGQVDVQTAQSGIALAIKFMPTLAKLEQRDLSGVDRLVQMFYDWKFWHQVYEGQTLTGDIVATLGAKLPSNATEAVNILNNMKDRDVVSARTYRVEMAKFGFKFPDDEDKQIDKEKQAAAERAALLAPPGLQPNAAAAAAGTKAPPPNPNPAGQPLDRSKNQTRRNESSGTEATQTLNRQAQGAKP